MRPPLVALLALGVAACGGQGGGANRAATSATATTPLQAGRWAMTMRAVSIEMPNAPPEIAAQLRARPLPPQEITYDCVTPQEAANPMEGLRQQLIHDQPNLSCAPTSQQFSDGRIRIALDCRGLNGQADQQVAMVGSFTTSLQAAVSTTTTAPVAGAMQQVQVENTMTGRRVGECTGTETE